jgi:hypothetical protein
MPAVRTAALSNVIVAVQPPTPQTAIKYHPIGSIAPGKGFFNN